ncbi:MAG: DUF2029 domain-containing protein [Thermoflexales bacterium]|nr:DUF2029 domain-containing protein [Thermoflexales bacterium]
MFEEFAWLYQVDWRIFMAAAQAWLQGISPYGVLSPDFSAGAFAYPPTALTWLALFLPLQAWGFYVWTGLELLLWWWLIRDRGRSQLVLLCWVPLLGNLRGGQMSLGIVLVLWAAFSAPRRGLCWGMALAWTLTKPQVAILPLLCLLWQERSSPLRWRLWTGMVLGTLALALPPTLLRPEIWIEWLASLGSYRGRILQMAAWQGPSVLLLALAAFLWHRSRYGGWHWWLAAAIFPHVGCYAMIVLLPMLRPRQNYWTLAGLGLAGVLQGPATPSLLPWLLAGHILAAWMVAGGPISSTKDTKLQNPQPET